MQSKVLKLNGGPFNKSLFELTSLFDALIELHTNDMTLLKFCFLQFSLIRSIFFFVLSKATIRPWNKKN